MESCDKSIDVQSFDEQVFHEEIEERDWSTENVREQKCPHYDCMSFVDVGPEFESSADIGKSVDIASVDFVDSVCTEGKLQNVVGTEVGKQVFHDMQEFLDMAMASDMHNKVLISHHHQSPRDQSFVHAAPQTIPAPKAKMAPKAKEAPKAKADQTAPPPPSSRATDNAIAVIRAAADKGEATTAEMIQSAAQSSMFSKDPELKKLDMRDWNAFNRGLVPSDNVFRTTNKDLCPNDIALQCAEDMNKKKLWYVRWLASGKSYVKATAWESSEEKSKQTDSDGDMWMTEGQILHYFKCAIVSAELIRECKANPKLWRAHPRIPHCPEATQYYILYKNKRTSETSKATKRGCVVTADVDNDAATTLMARHAGSSLQTPGETFAVSPPQAEETERERKLRRLEEAEDVSRAGGCP